MAEMKTKKTNASPEDFLNTISDAEKRKDAFEIMKMMQKATGSKPKMWGPAIIGFGHMHYKYESGREADWFLMGFSPRKQNLTFYIMSGIENFPGHLKKLGKYKLSKSCLYINKLNEVNIDVLMKLLDDGYKSTIEMAKKKNWL